MEVTLSLLIRAVGGVVSLLFGRPLFWFFVALAGFLGGVSLGPTLFPQAEPLVTVIVGLVIGIVLAILAVFAQRIIIAIVGFLGIGAGLVGLVNILTTIPSGSPLYWLVFVVGGIIGVVLASITFDWALIILSSLSGAIALTQVVQQLLPLPGVLTAMVFIGFALVGIAFQARQYRKT